VLSAARQGICMHGIGTLIRRLNGDALLSPQPTPPPPTRSVFSPSSAAVCWRKGLAKGLIGRSEMREGRERDGSGLRGIGELHGERSVQSALSVSRIFLAIQGDREERHLLAIHLVYSVFKE